MGDTLWCVVWWCGRLAGDVRINSVADMRETAGRTAERTSVNGWCRVKAAVEVRVRDDIARMGDLTSTLNLCTEHVM